MKTLMVSMSGLSAISTIKCRLKRAIPLITTDKKIWGKLTIALGPRKNVEYTAQDDFFVDELFSKRDLSIHRLGKVKRENRVFTERRFRSVPAAASVWSVHRFYGDWHDDQIC